MKQKGRLVKWHADKGFGFIQPMIVSKPIFIHKNAFINKTRSPKLNDIITYVISNDKQGRPCATEATFSGEKIAVKAPKSVNRFSIYLALVFLAFISLAAWLGHFPRVLLISYWTLSVVTYLAYAWDKSSAKRDGWRTSEQTLHLLALFGGWPGAAIAQQHLRHKSLKKSFRMVFWLTVMVNLAALIWLVWAGGESLVP
jgi:uncharacterized membrane protein YsdA (DUF1294 family)/cold shock CspA family protein